MVKQNAITNIGIKRSRYFLSFHFLSFLPFRRFSYDLKVFFHTNLHMGNLQESDCPFVSSWNLKPLFCWLSFAVTCYNLLCQSLYHSLSIDVSLICLFFINDRFSRWVSLSRDYIVQFAPNFFHMLCWKYFDGLNLLHISLIRFNHLHLTFSWRGPLSYRNQSIDLRSKSVDWFLYDNGFRHERVKKKLKNKWNIKAWFLISKIYLAKLLLYI